jgi:type II secretory ATPase GspE/PulE/Tfp pilus assembly ATPase PilB-like protein
MAQRLLKGICSACVTEAEVPDSITRQGFPPLEKCYRGRGCKECNNSGYRGRIGVFEFLPMNARIRRLIARNASEDELWEAARESGTVTLFEDAWQKVSAGITTVEEVISKIPFNPALHK